MEEINIETFDTLINEINTNVDKANELMKQYEVGTEKYSALYCIIQDSLNAIYHLVKSRKSAISANLITNAHNRGLYEQNIFLPARNLEL